MIISHSKLHWRKNWREKKNAQKRAEKMKSRNSAAKFDQIDPKVLRKLSTLYIRGLPHCSGNHWMEISTSNPVGNWLVKYFKNVLKINTLHRWIYRLSGITIKNRFPRQSVMLKGRQSQLNPSSTVAANTRWRVWAAKLSYIGINILHALWLLMVVAAAVDFFHFPKSDFSFLP